MQTLLERISGQRQPNSNIELAKYPLNGLKVFKKKDHLHGTRGTSTAAGVRALMRFGPNASAAGKGTSDTDSSGGKVERTSYTIQEIRRASEMSNIFVSTDTGVISLKKRLMTSGKPTPHNFCAVVNTFP